MSKRTTAKTANCRRCHALLTNPRSVAKRVTKHCERLERLEAAERAAAEAARREAAVDAALAQVDLSAFVDPHPVLQKATQLLMDDAVVPHRHAGLYVVTSASSDAVYVTDVVERSCTCQAGARHGRCSHLVAADAHPLLAEILTTPDHPAVALAA